MLSCMVLACWLRLLDSDRQGGSWGRKLALDWLGKASGGYRDRFWSLARVLGFVKTGMVPI